jgi:hypothetical protein
MVKVSIEANKCRERLPVPWMRTASARSGGSIGPQSL